MGKQDRAVLFRQIDRLYRRGTFTVQSDEALLNRFLADRDEEAFETLVDLHGPMVLSLCRRILRDPRDIEDAFQATFLILARKAGSIRRRGGLSSWLHGVAYRVASRSRAELLGRRAREAGVPVEELADDRLAGMTELDEIGPALDQEVNRLPDKYRTPIILCYFRDQTHDQAAAELHWPVGTVRSRLARGRALLRDRLTRRGCSPSAFLPLISSGASHRFFLATVPEPLLRATVAGASRFLWGTTTLLGPTALFSMSSSTSTLSGPSVLLAHGVLSTMVLTQVKIIGAVCAATGLLFGGIGLGAWAGSPVAMLPSMSQDPPARPPQPTPDAAPTPIPMPRTDAVSLPLPTPRASLPSNPITDTSEAIPPSDHSEPGTVEERLAALERKLEMILKRLPPVPVLPSPDRPDSPPSMTLPAPSAEPARNPNVLAPLAEPTPDSPMIPPPHAENPLAHRLPPQPEPNAPSAEPLLSPHAERGVALPPQPEPNVPSAEPAIADDGKNPFQMDEPDSELPQPRRITARPAVRQPSRMPSPAVDEVNDTDDQPPVPSPRTPARKPDLVAVPRNDRAADEAPGGSLNSSLLTLPSWLTIKEYEVKLRSAIRIAETTKAQHEKGIISSGEYDLAIDNVKLVTASLDALMMNLEENLDRLNAFPVDERENQFLGTQIQRRMSKIKEILAKVPKAYQD